jgi:hypothetical protein
MQERRRAERRIESRGYAEERRRPGERPHDGPERRLDQRRIRDRRFRERRVDSLDTPS